MLAKWWTHYNQEENTARLKTFPARAGSAGMMGQEEGDISHPVAELERDSAIQVRLLTIRSAPKCCWLQLRASLVRGATMWRFPWLLCSYSCRVLIGGSEVWVKAGHVHLLPWRNFWRPVYLDKDLFWTSIALNHHIWCCSQFPD